MPAEKWVFSKWEARGHSISTNCDGLVIVSRFSRTGPCLWDSQPSTFCSAAVCPAPACLCDLLHHERVLSCALVAFCSCSFHRCSHTWVAGDCWWPRVVSHRVCFLLGIFYKRVPFILCFRGGLFVWFHENDFSFFDACKVSLFLHACMRVCLRNVSNGICCVRVERLIAATREVLYVCERSLPLEVRAGF